MLYQSKNFDGSGFPEDKLYGEYIPLGARILRVINDIVLEVDKGRALSEIIEGMLLIKGQYDPKILAACQRILPELSGILSGGAHDEVRSYVKVADLRVDSRLCSHIQSTEGMIIAHEGTVVTPAVLQRVHNFSTIMKIKEPIEVVLPKA